MITLKNPVSVSVFREGSAWLYTDPCCKTEAGVLMMGKRYKFDLESGDLVNRWRFIKDLGGYPRKCLWVCPLCGKKKEVYLVNIRHGKQKSCGCLRRVVRNPYYKTRLYNTWDKIKQRCTNKNNDMYHHYGGRDIKMYKPWVNNPIKFIEYCMTLDEWDNNSLSIDRIDNDGNYEPGNVRWATNKIQARNKRVLNVGGSGYTGVGETKSQRGKGFIARIHVNNLSVHIGSYNTAKEAAIARDQYIIDNNLEGFNLQIL